MVSNRNNILERRAMKRAPLFFSKTNLRKVPTDKVALSDGATGSFDAPGTEASGHPFQPLIGRFWKKDDLIHKNFI